MNEIEGGTRTLNAFTTPDFRYLSFQSLTLPFYQNYKTVLTSIIFSRTVL